MDNLRVVPLHKTPRVLVVGTPGWTIKEIVPRMLLDWWIEQERPHFHVIVMKDEVGQLALATLNPEIVTSEVIRYQHVRNPIRRAQLDALEGTPIDQAFVFRVNADEIAGSWIDALRLRGTPTVVVGIDYVKSWPDDAA